jgi:phage terminase large subunit-like protein
MPGEPSWTVVSSFYVTPNWDLLWWKVHRVRVEIPGVLEAIRSEFNQRIADRDGQPEFIGIEDSGLGIGVFQMALLAGLPVKPMRPMGNDKIVRATDAINRMERGKIWLPEQAPWLEDCETELFTWTGHPMEQADQIDTLAYAALEVSREAGSDAPMTGDSMPMAMSTAGGLPW